MANFCTRLIVVGMLFTLLLSVPSSALTLLSPTEDQIVREKVKITVPLSALPADFEPSDSENPPMKSRPFISLVVEGAGIEQLVAAYSPDAAIIANGRVTVYWDTKQPYRDSSAPTVDKYYKDGRYKLTVNVHDFNGKIVDSATVNVELRNRVPRSNPAPAVNLVNRFMLGQTNVYKVHASVQIYQMISGVGLPILGGMGMTSDFKIIQSVEDVRPNGELMLRYRMDPDGYLSSFGKRVPLYAPDQPKPQLYRLVDKYGNVINRNIFSRQGIYTIMDVIPMLPSRPVKEGDAWPTTFDLKIEGITNVIPLTGTSTLDCFEWQNGHECAKIISILSGNSVISMNGDKIRSSSNKVDVQMVTYFAYKIGKMLRREVTLEFPAHIMPGAEEIQGETGTPTPTPTPPLPGPTMPNPGVYDETDQEDLPAIGPMRPSYKRSRASGSTGTVESGVKKGTVQVNVLITLEK